MNEDIRDRLQLMVGDITRLAVDIIVNAANEAMCGGGGVDGAIHRAAGPALLEECLKIGHCPQGQAVITKAYLLPARHIVHTVGPVWEGGGHDEAGTLTSCYRSSLTLAEKHGARTVAFPCIATGVYGYPKAQACDLAVDAVTQWLRGHDLPQRVIFCCFGNDDAELYRARLANLV